MEKLTFDGNARTMTVNAGFTRISIKIDVYSGWKRWIKQSDNAKYSQAIRVIGGDPVGSSQFAGDQYFLMNNWQLVIPHRVYADGVLYHDNSIDPFNVLPGGGITSVVSNLAQTVAISGGSVGVDIDQIAIATANRIIPEINIVQTTLSNMQIKLNELQTLIEAHPDYMPQFIELKNMIDETKTLVTAGL